MNLRLRLTTDLSGEDIALLAEWAKSNPEGLDELISLLIAPDARIVQRASRILVPIAERAPHLVEAYLDTFTALLGQSRLHGAVKRNLVRLIQYLELPEHLHADLLGICFRFLEDPEEAVAVKAFSMTILGKLARTYPDIRQELKLVIEDGLSRSPSPGYKSRARKILANLAGAEVRPSS